MIRRDEVGICISHNKRNETTYKRVHPGEFVLHLRSFQGGFAHSAIDGITSPAYTVFRCKDCSKHCGYFWKRVFMSEAFIKSLEKITYGIRDGRSISYEEFEEMMLAFPALPEQQRMASFFANLDQAISAADARLEKLRQTKAALLEKMFPQPGQSIPEIRFAGFDGTWNQAAAKQIFEQTNERNHPELPVLSANQERGMIRRADGDKNIAHDRHNETTYKRVHPGQFVLHLRSFQGGFAHSAIDGITSPAYTVFRFKNESAHCDWFWKIVFMSDAFIRSLRRITYGIRDGRSVSYEEFEEMDIAYPSLLEQRRISTFFLEMDALIFATEAKAKKLRQIKAALLEGMFV